MRKGIKLDGRKQRSTRLHHHHLGGKRRQDLQDDIRLVHFGRRRHDLGSRFRIMIIGVIDPQACPGFHQDTMTTVGQHVDRFGSQSQTAFSFHPFTGNTYQQAIAHLTEFFQ